MNLTDIKINKIKSQLAEKAAQSDLNTTNTNVANNTATIATHTSQIATNTANIASNATAIANIGNSSPKGTYATLTELQTAYPTGATGIYVVTADGKWYYWSGSAWVAGGTYQGTGIADISVTTPKLNVPYLSSYQNIGYTDKSNYLSPSINTTSATVNCNLTPYTTLPIGKYLIYVDVNVSVTTLPSGRFVPIVFTGASNIMANTSDANGLFPRVVNLQSLNNVIAYGIVDVTSQVSARIGFVMTEQNIGVTNTYTVTANKVYAIKLDSVDNEVIKALNFYNDTLQYVPVIKLPTNTNEEQMQSDISTIQGDITSIQESMPIKAPIICHGDSMTGATLGWVNTLETTYNLNVLNRGIGGQTAGQIATRQGGLPLIINPFTIPADTSQVSVTLNQTLYAQQSVFEGINPVYVNGIKGTLRNSTNSANGFTFARSEVGSAVPITRPTVVFTDNMINYRTKPMIIWIGTNGDYNTSSRTSANLISIIEQMLSYGECKNYLIIGLTTDTTFNIPSINTDLSNKYGRRFLDLRSYMIQYGLDDMGWTATSDDTTRIAANNVPSSLLADTTHFKTEVQQQVIAPLVYKKLQELYMI